MIRSSFSIFLSLWFLFRLKARDVIVSSAFIVCFPSEEKEDAIHWMQWRPVGGAGKKLCLLLRSEKARSLAPKVSRSVASNSGPDFDKSALVVIRLVVDE